MTVELGTAISVSARSCRLFDVYGIACFLEELNFSTLHYPLKVSLYEHSICPSIRSSGPLMDTSAYKKTSLHAGWPAFFLFAKYIINIL